MNTKANALVGFGGAILAILLGTQSAWLTGNDVSRSLAILSGVLLIFSVVFAYLGYQLQSYRADPDPEGLAENYRHKPPSATLTALMSNLVARFKHNEIAIKRRVLRIKWAFVLQLFAVVTLGLATLYSILRNAKTF